VTLPTALALAAAVFVLGVTPGPGVFAGVARALASGLGPALAFATGMVGGDIVLLLLVVFGLAAVAETMGELFLFVKIAGGAYLVWLGISYGGRSRTRREPGRGRARLLAQPPRRLRPDARQAEGDPVLCSVPAELHRCRAPSISASHWPGAARTSVACAGSSSAPDMGSHVGGDATSSTSPRAAASSLVALVMGSYSSTLA
jgi:hypothetical protein